MTSAPQRRRVTLFLISVLIPAVVLAGLAVQLYRQQQRLIEQDLERQRDLAHTAEQIHSVYRESNLRFAFYGCAVFLALSATLFCRYVVWQDYRRETELADLRSQFVAHVSHELRTPLTSIQMFAETLALGRVQDPEKQREYLETIARESERLARLVDQVLAFSKIEQGREYRLQSMALTPIVEAAARAVEPSLTQQGFTLRRIYSGCAPTVRADADALEQAILNLLTNAMKYSSDSRDIELQLRQCGSDVFIDVLDQGIGVPAQFREKIFEKFFRAPLAAGVAVPGVGLGLTLVAHVAASHGGRVEVRSNEPKGSVFSLILPMEQKA
jgi:two-component system, OmpR family, phosphate regulon sensor histidine kinase PhoR